MSGDEARNVYQHVEQQCNELRALRYVELARILRPLVQLGARQETVADLRGLLRRLVNGTVQINWAEMRVQENQAEHYRLFSRLRAFIDWLQNDRNAPPYYELVRLLDDLTRLHAGADTIRDLQHLLRNVRGWSDVQAESALRYATRRLVQHDQSRISALRRQDTLLARRALDEVVGDLKDILATVESAIRISTNKVSVRDAVPSRLALKTLRTLPLYEIAKILDLSTWQTEQTLSKLATYDRATFGAHDKDLIAGLHSLREQLDTIQKTEDHSRLDVVVKTVAKIACAVAIAAAAAPLAALAVGDSLTAEMIKSAVAALIVVTLQMTLESSLEKRRQRNPYRLAQHAHDRLKSELGRFSDACSGHPHYLKELTIAYIRLVARTYAARMSTIGIQWSNKFEYWTTLDGLDERALDEMMFDRHADWRIARRTLHSFHLPTSATSDDISRSEGMVQRRPATVDGHEQVPPPAAHETPGRESVGGRPTRVNSLKSNKRLRLRPPG